MSSTDRSRESRVALPVAVTLAVGIGLTVLAFFALRGREFSSVIKVVFERDAQDRMSAVQNQVGDAIESLAHLRGMYNASEHISRSEFGVFASTLIRYPVRGALPAPMIYAADDPGIPAADSCTLAELIPDARRVEHESAGSSENTSRLPCQPLRCRAAQRSRFCSEMSWSRC